MHQLLGFGHLSLTAESSAAAEGQEYRRSGAVPPPPNLHDLPFTTGSAERIVEALGRSILLVNSKKYSGGSCGFNAAHRKRPK